VEGIREQEPTERTEGSGQKEAKAAKRGEERETKGELAADETMRPSGTTERGGG
jgi:hypothetical protein